jgi:hypothetical protein
MESAPSEPPATAPTTTPDVLINPEDYGAAILFLEMKGRMQENRITELEEMVRVLATEIQKGIPENTSTNTTNNTTNVNLIVQMSVDNDNKVGVISGMGRVPDIPDVVREQLEHVIPLSINSLFVKNKRLNDEGDTAKKGILQYACQDGAPWDDDPWDDNEVVLGKSDSTVAPGNNGAFKDEDIREGVRKMLMGAVGGGAVP